MVWVLVSQALCRLLTREPETDLNRRRDCVTLGVSVTSHNAQKEAGCGAGCRLPVLPEFCVRRAPSAGGRG